MSMLKNIRKPAQKILSQYIQKQIIPVCSNEYSRQLPLHNHRLAIVKIARYGTSTYTLKESWAQKKLRSITKLENRSKYSPHCSLFLLQNRSISSSANLRARDYYETLGIARNAPAKDIKKAYYQLAKKYHPDVNKDNQAAAKKFQEASEAYEVLSDEQKRKEYDTFGSSPSGPQQQQHNPFSQQGRKGNFRWEYKANVNPEELFRSIFGEFTRGFGQSTREGKRSGFSAFEDFSPFGFGGAQETTVQITFQQAAKGVNKEIEIIEASGDFRSPRIEKRRLTIAIPGGIEDGQTLRMSIGGNKEIFVTVRVEQSNYFRREAFDVHSDANISLSQSMLGGIIRIQGLYEDLNLRIPPGTSSHSVLTLSERGFKRLDAVHAHGDHFVHLKIKVPSYLTEEQKDLIKQFAYLEENTPGTISGIDRSRPRPSQHHRQSDPKTSSESSGTSASDNENTYEPSENSVIDTENEGFFSKMKRKLFG